MSSVRVRLALLGVALTARVLADASYLLGSAGSAVLLLAPALVLSPLLAPLLGRLPSFVVLAVAGLALPQAVPVPLPVPVAVAWVATGGLVFLVAGLLLLADLCREGRVSFPRTAGLLAAATIALGLALGLAVDPPGQLALAGLAGIAAVASAWGQPAPERRPSWAAVAAPPGRGFLFAGLAFVVLSTAALRPVADQEPTALLVGAAAGCLLAAWQRNGWRNPALIPLAGILLFVGLALLALFGPEATAMQVTLGIAVGLGGVAFVVGLVRAVPGYGLLVAAGLTLPAFLVGAALPTWFVLLLPLTALFVGLAGWWVLTPLFEQLLETGGAWTCRIFVAGPGPDAIPADGPVILVANHSAYLDPMWVMKVVPRRVIPMMTSVFYDLPVIRWVMATITRAIRVPATTFRREAPELQEAVAVLQAGGCLLVFPEARLRKTQEKLLYPFGQGLWHVVRAVPNVRVVAVWIEGGWGSWTSQANGQPPFRDKPVDCLRRIELAFGPAEAIPPELLADREAFRNWLMGRVLACRAYLNLPVPTVEQALGRAADTTEVKPHEIDSDLEANRS